MSVTAPPPSAAPTPVTYAADASIATFSVARYQRMIEAGVLTSEDKVELLENYVVLKMPRNPRHDGTVEVIDNYLRTVIPAGWRVRCQLTLSLADSQPEPDFVIARGDARSAFGRHPTPADAGLVVEVADSSLLRDQRDKTRIYARAGVAVYWVVNLADRRVEEYTGPSGPAAAPTYTAVRTYAPGDAIPLTLDGRAVSVAAAELLP